MIQIIEEMKASPSSLPLPKRVELDMILSSSEKTERCRIVYTLADDNDVEFDDGTKRDERSEDIARAATPVTHRVSLRQRPTGSHPASIQLTQDIFDATGSSIRTQILLKIKRTQP